MTPALVVIPLIFTAAVIVFAASVYRRNRLEKRSGQLVKNGRANVGEVLTKLSRAMRELYDFATPRLRKDADRQYLNDIREADKRLFIQASAALRAVDNAIASNVMSRANDQIRLAREIFNKIERHEAQLHERIAQITASNEELLSKFATVRRHYQAAVQSAQVLCAANTNLDPARFFLRGATLIASAEQVYLSPIGDAGNVSELLQEAVVAIDTSHRDLEYVISRHAAVAGVLENLPPRIAALTQKISDARAAETKLRMRYGVRMESLEYRLSMLPNRLCEAERLRRDVASRSASLDMKRAENALDALEALLREIDVVTSEAINKVRQYDEDAASKDRQQPEAARSATLTPRTANMWHVETQQSATKP